MEVAMAVIAQLARLRLKKAEMTSGHRFEAVGGGKLRCQRCHATGTLHEIVEMFEDTGLAECVGPSKERP